MQSFSLDWDSLSEEDVAIEAFNIAHEAAQKKVKSGEERVCCDTCGVSCKDRESLKRHRRKKHTRAIIASGSGNEITG